MKRSLWFSTDKITAQVEIDAGKKIVYAAPIFRKFVGQPLANLIAWLSNQGQISVTETTDPDDIIEGPPTEFWP